jgi:hypothetical protein
MRAYCSFDAKKSRKGSEATQAGAEGSRTLEIRFADQRDFRLWNNLRTFVRLSIIDSHFVRISHAIKVRDAWLPSNDISRMRSIQRTCVLRMVESKFAEDKSLRSFLIRRCKAHFLAWFTWIPRAWLKERYVTWKENNVNLAGNRLCTARGAYDVLSSYELLSKKVQNTI